MKIPRVPGRRRRDGQRAAPTYRNLWARIRDRAAEEEREGDRRREGAAAASRRAPGGAAQRCTATTRSSTDAGRSASGPSARHHAAGVHRRLQQHERLEAGLRLRRRLGEGVPDGMTRGGAGRARPALERARTAGGCDRPQTILIDSRAARVGRGDERRLQGGRRPRDRRVQGARYRARLPGRDVDELTDEDLLREVMNTVGKPGKLGEQRPLRRQSVSMLTEGWDANTVTHILGVRAFGTQLLCEQVVGRGLRRMSYVADDDGLLRAGVRRGVRRAVQLHPHLGIGRRSEAGALMTRVRALPERAALRDPLPARRRLPLRAVDGERLALDVRRRVASSRSRPKDVPTETEVAGIVGEREIHDSRRPAVAARAGGSCSRSRASWQARHFR